MRGRAFSADISRFVAKANGNIDNVVKKVTIDLLSSVVMMSPVDTGRFRANWQVKMDVLPRGLTDVTDKSGKVAITAGTRVISTFKIGINGIYIANSLPYALKLEYGSSKQAPHGMVRVTAVQFSRFVAKASRGV